MSLRAPRPLSAEWFIPEQEEDAATPTRFKVRGLKGIDYQAILGSTRIIDEERIVFDAHATREMLKKGLLDWENYLDHEGKPLDYSQVNANKNIDLLGVSMITAIARRIVELTELTSDERKNLSSQSKSPPDHSTAQLVPGGDTVPQKPVRLSSSGKSKG